MILAVCSHKGGTGKTTTSLSLAVSFSKMGKRVLAVDLDPQANLSYSIDLSPEESDISDLFTGDKSFEDSVKHLFGIDVLGSSEKLADIELSLQSADQRTHYLNEILSGVTENYDVIILDCPPSRSLLTVNALVAADFALTPVLLDVLSIQGMLYMTRTILDIRKTYNPGLTFLGLLAVNVDLRKNIAKEVLNVFREETNYPVFKTLIRTNTKIAEAPSHGLPIQYYQPRSTASLDYSKLAVEVWDQMNKYGIGKKIKAGSAHTAY